MKTNGDASRNPSGPDAVGPLDTGALGGAPDDAAIARYRTELAAEAALARGDLDEIEDHLRALASELRERGIPRAEAIALACQRLGDPRAIAREHARVRSPFGPRLSPMRAWSAVALVAAPMLYWLAVWGGPRSWASPEGVDVALAGVVLAALATRRTWAQPIVAGSLVAMLPVGLLYLAAQPNTFALASLVARAGALAFVLPWRRTEITAPAAALALLAIAYLPALQSLELLFTAPMNIVLANPLGVTAFSCILFAGAGILLRARWAALPAACAAIALFGYGKELEDLTFRMVYPELSRFVMIAAVYAGAASAAVAAVLGWRAGSWRIGTLRHVLD